MVLFSGFHLFIEEKWTIISIERNIGVISSKTVYMIGWWPDTDSFVNGKFLLLNELLTSKILTVSIYISTIEMLILNDSSCATGL